MCKKQIIVISVRIVDHNSGYMTSITISINLPKLIVAQKAGTGLKIFTLNVSNYSEINKR